MTSSRIELGPVPLDQLDFDAVLGTIRERIVSRHSSQIVTLNALMFNIALRDPSFAGIVTNAALVVPDSAGISWAARILRDARVARLPGIDLMHGMCAQAAKNGWRVFLLGSRPGIAERAAENLIAQYPGLTVVDTHHGYFGAGGDAAIVEKVRASAADILFVGLAIPGQERWIASHRASLGVPVIMGVGGSLDVVSGDLRRAPSWMRRRGLEWLFRTLQQPWRIRRIANLPVFVLNVLKLRCFGPPEQISRG